MCLRYAICLISFTTVPDWCFTRLKLFVYLTHTLRAKRGACQFTNARKMKAKRCVLRQLN